MMMILWLIQLCFSHLFPTGTQDLAFVVGGDDDLSFLLLFLLLVSATSLDRVESVINNNKAHNFCRRRLFGALAEIAL